MMDHHDFRYLRRKLLGMLRRRPEMAGLVLSHGRYKFGGQTIEHPFVSFLQNPDGGPWTSWVTRLDDDVLEVRHVLNGALLAHMPYKQGQMAAAMAVWEDGEDERCILALAKVDTSGMQPEHDFLVPVDGKQRARIGSVVGSVQDVGHDGRLRFLERLSGGRWPGSGRPPGDASQLTIPISVSVNGKGGPLAARLPDLIRIPQPDPAELLAWSNAHYGSLDLEEGPMLPFPSDTVA